MKMDKHGKVDQRFRIGIRLGLALVRVKIRMRVRLGLVKAKTNSTKCAWTKSSAIISCIKQAMYKISNIHLVLQPQNIFQ